MRLSRKAIYPFLIFFAHSASANEILSLSHQFGKGLGYKSGYTSLEGYFDIDTIDWVVPFTDLRVHYFDNNEWAANGGIGARFWPGYDENVFGINGFFDYRLDHGNSYTQTGMGLEFLNNSLGIFLNGYLPLLSSHKVEKCRFFYPGGFFVFTDHYRRAMYGGDFEIGFFVDDSLGNAGFYGGGGVYLYHGDELPMITGGRLHVWAYWTNYISLEGTASYDSVFKARIQGGIAIHIPFGGSYGKDKKFYRRVNRNPIIVIDDTCCWKFNY